MVGGVSGFPSRAVLRGGFNCSERAIHATLRRLRSRKLVAQMHKDKACISCRNDARGRSHRQINLLLDCCSSCLFPRICSKVRSTLARGKCKVRITMAGGHLGSRTLCLRKLVGDGISKLVVRNSQSTFPGPGVHLFERVQGHGVPALFVRGRCRGRLFSDMRVRSTETTCRLAGVLVRRKRHQVNKVFGCSSVRKVRHCGKFVRYLSSCNIGFSSSYIH